MTYGFVKVAAAIPKTKVADCIYNTIEIEKLIREAGQKHIEIIVFPELCITSYTCGDLFTQQLLIKSAEKALKKLIDKTSDEKLLCVVGAPVTNGNQIFNAAIAFQGGKILGVIPKTFLPNYKEFYEKRWFASSMDNRQTSISLCGQDVPFGTDLLFRSGEVVIGTEICEDLWVTVPPSSLQALNGANILLNLSASNELIGKQIYREELIRQQSTRCNAAYIYASAGSGESSTDLVFAGNGIIAENGTILAESQRFISEKQLIMSEIDIDRLLFDRRINSGYNSCSMYSTEKYRNIDFHLPTYELTELKRTITPHPFIPSENKLLFDRCEEIFNIQITGLAKRIIHTHAQSVVIGISGGLDSTLALLVCVKTFDRLKLNREQIVGVTMPGFGTTDRTYHNAKELMKLLGVTIREISIKEACTQHFKDINHDINIHDITYENSQARERTQILMDIANQNNGLVIGTGDLSELALGWATYNGDHMSMYGVNGSIPKTLVRYLVEWAASQEISAETKHTLLDIVNTPISPELIPGDEHGNIKQKTEDLVGPYELHDFFLYYFLRFGLRPSKIYFLARQAFKGKYDTSTIQKWLTIFFKRFFNQQFKRSCLPDGPKVGSVSLSPRGDWKMPSDANSTIWIKECEELPL